jgi:hypothetical protein
MTLPKVKSGGAPRQDRETEAMLYEGVTITQLSTLFRMDNRDVKAKLGDLKPCGHRGNTVIYSLKEAAGKLAAPVITDYNAFIKAMTTANLPSILKKEFWAGMRSRQLFEIEDGQLWREEEVATALSELLKTLKMNLLLIRDSVDREVELTERQREIVTRYIDKSLGNLHASVRKHFIKRLERTGFRIDGEASSSESAEDEEL